MTLTQLPNGVAGLLVAAVLGSTMSVFSGGLNAAATSFYVDIWSQNRARAETTNVASFTRGLTIALSAVAIAIAFLAAEIGGLVKMSNIVLGAVAGPLLGLFLLGMTTERANEQSAMCGMAVAMVVGLYFGASQTLCPIKSPPLPCESDGSVWGLPISRLQSWWLGVPTTAAAYFVGYAASLLWKSPRAAGRDLTGLTLYSQRRGEGRPKNHDRRGLSSSVNAALLGAVAD